MVGNTQLASDRIASIIALYKEDKTPKEICDITGVSRRSVQRWIKKYNDRGGSAIPTHEKRPGKARKTTPRALDVLKSQVDADPRLSAKDLKEKNPKLLRDVSVRTVQRRLFEDLKYRNCRRRQKPQQTHGGGWRVYRRPDCDPNDPKCTESTGMVPASLMENGMVSAAEDSDEEDLEKPSITHEEIDPTPAIGDEDLEQPSIKEEEIDPTPDIGDTKEGASVAIALDVVVPPKTAITDGGRDLDDAQEDVLATSMTEGTDRVVPAGEHEDEFHHFGMYVASQLRGMPPRAAVEAQLEIQRALTMKRLQYLQ